MQRETVGRTLLVAFVLCVVCSVLVSSAAVGLRPIQEENREVERMRNILVVAGLYEEGTPVRDTFDELVEARLVDLETGEYVSGGELDPLTFSARDATKDHQLSVSIDPEDDLGGIKRRSKYEVVYLVNKADGSLDQVVLPISGKGLWSTLYGFLAIDSDMRTIRGITFYEHAETPGLGGEIDNPNWKAQWPGKQAFDEEWNVAIEVVKGPIVERDPEATFWIDALSGATITSRGVTNLLRYWLGPNALGPYFENMRQELQIAGDTNG